jgi:hypothetical protein
MKRSPLVYPWVIADNLKRLWVVFRRQRMLSNLLLGVVLLGLGVVFAFLAFAPALSPFVYPLF